MKHYFYLACALILLSGCLSKAGLVYAEPDETPDPYEMLKTALDIFENQVDDYTATFVKQQRINGKLHNEESMELKFMKPFSVYYRWNYPDKGKEVLYVHGKNKNKILGHLGGAAGFFPFSKWLDPDDPMAMATNKYPITRSGLGTMLKLMIAQYDLARQNGELEATYAGTEVIDGKRTHVLIRRLPKKDIYACYLSIVNIDMETQLPIRVVSLNWDFSIEEIYYIRNLKINQGLTEGDFSPNNREYNFGFLKF